MRTQKLSTNKSNYLLSKPSEVKQLSVAECKRIAKHYKNKYQIEIIVNGTTEFGKKCIEQNRQVAIDLLDSLQDDNKKYYALFHDYINIQFDENHPVWPPKYLLKIIETGQKIFYEHMDKLISKFTNSSIDDESKKDFKATINDFFALISNIVNGVPLSKNDLEDLNMICDSLPFLQDMINEFKLFLSERIENICLTARQAEQEALIIQETSTHKIGYVFTNNCLTSEEHFEVLIISKENIIKPIQWFKGPKSIEMDHLGICYWPNTYEPNVFGYDETGTLIPSGKLPRAQADKNLCGYLGLLYLKELLKKNEFQLRELSFMFSYYPVEKSDDNDLSKKNAKVDYFFFPPPHVLKDSQSNLFNEILVSMLEDSNEIQTITHKNKTYRVKTVNMMLNETLQIAKENNQTDLYNETLKALEALPTFRKKWTEIYLDESEYRSQMCYDKENVYLLYSSARLFGISTRVQNSEEMEKHDEIKESTSLDTARR